MCSAAFLASTSAIASMHSQEAQAQAEQLPLVAHAAEEGAKANQSG